MSNNNNRIGGAQPFQGFGPQMGPRLPAMGGQPVQNSQPQWSGGPKGNAPVVNGGSQPLKDGGGVWEPQEGAGSMNAPALGTQMPTKGPAPSGGITSRGTDQSVGFIPGVSRIEGGAQYMPPSGGIPGPWQASSEFAAARAANIAPKGPMNEGVDAGEMPPPALGTQMPTKPAPSMGGQTYTGQAAWDIMAGRGAPQQAATQSPILPPQTQQPAQNLGIGTGGLSPVEQPNLQMPGVGNWTPPNVDFTPQSIPTTDRFNPVAPQYTNVNLPEAQGFNAPQVQNRQLQMQKLQDLERSFADQPTATSNFAAGNWRGDDNAGRQQLVDSITQSVNRNFSENVLPQIKSASYLAGGYGGAGQGIAEGLAASRINQDITGALASPLFGSFENAQNRGLQAAMNSDQLNSQNSQFNAGQRNSMLTSLLGLGNQATGQNQNFALGLGGLQNQMTGQDQNYALGLGGQALQARGQDQSYNLGRAGVDTQNRANANNLALGLGSQGLQARGQDQSFALGQAGVNSQDRATANNFALGLGSQGLTARGQDQSYNLGVGNLGLGGYNAMTGRMGQGTNQFQADTQRMLGNRGADTQDFNAMTGRLGQGTNQFGADTQRMLGMMGQGTNQYQAETGRMGTMGNLGLGQQAQDTNFMNMLGQLGLGFGNLGLNQEIANNNFYTSQRGQDMQGLQIGAGLIGQGQNGLINGMQGMYNAGNQEFNAPWNSLQQYSNLVGPFMGLGQTQRGTQSYTYNPTMQWIGTAAQAAGPMAALFSDKRLKENIKRVGKTDDGLGVYTYNYKGDYVPQMGVMAQEVEKKRPDALGPTVGGFRTVNYGALG